MGFELILIPPFLKPIPLGLIVLLERKQGKPVVKPTRAHQGRDLNFYRCTSGLLSS